MYNILGERASQSPLFLLRNLRRPVPNDNDSDNDNDNNDDDDDDDDVVLVKHTLTTPAAVQLPDNTQPQAGKTTMQQHQRSKRRHSHKASSVVYRCTEPSVTWETSRRPYLCCAFCHVRHDSGRGWKNDRVELLRHLERCHSELRFSFGDGGMSSPSSGGHHHDHRDGDVTVIEVSFFIFFFTMMFVYIYTYYLYFG